MQNPWGLTFHVNPAPPDKEGNRMALHCETIDAPAAWIMALIYGDYSEMTSDDCAAIRAWRERELPSDASIVGTVEDSERFTWSYRLYGGTAAGGTVCTYQYLTANP